MSPCNYETLGVQFLFKKQILMREEKKNTNKIKLNLKNI